MDDNPYTTPRSTNVQEAPSKPLILRQPWPPMTFEVADLFIFMMVCAMSFSWFMKEDPNNIFPAWAFYAASVLYAAFVTYWSWIVRIFDLDAPPQSFGGRVVLVWVYMIPTWTVGHLTSLCIVYPNVLSILMVPTGLLLYGVTLCMVTEPSDARKAQDNATLPTHTDSEHHP